MNSLVGVKCDSEGLSHSHYMTQHIEAVIFDKRMQPSNVVYRENGYVETLHNVLCVNRLTV